MFMYVCLYSCKHLECYSYSITSSWYCKWKTLLEYKLYIKDTNNFLDNIFCLFFGFDIQISLFYALIATYYCVTAIYKYYNINICKEANTIPLQYAASLSTIKVNLLAWYALFHLVVVFYHIFCSIF